MSWQAAGFALLVLVLLGGFAWYERFRPPSRIVALVAALAALAVAGRLVLAPVPNVVATTDIVLFTGYAIGAGPGFTVGALAALVSNFWLGQGPWTPWQMAGWGLVGVGGAALAAVSGRRLGRWGLAAACGAAGLAYGALLDLSVMVSYGGEQSLERYLALSARGLPFNIAHAAGNVALALVAGPALVRMLLRYRARFQFHWREAPSPRAAGSPTRRAAGAGTALLVLLLASAASLAGPEGRAHAGGAESTRAWLERAQNGDGGFGTAPGASSSPAMTGWAMLGLEAAGRNPLDVRRDGRTPVDYLRGRAGDLRSTGDLERTILTVVGAGMSPRSFAGRDLVAALRDRRLRDGSFQGQVNLTAFGILALRAAGSTGLVVSATWLRRMQNADGGWGFRPGASSDPDSTGAVLQALKAAGEGGGAVSTGVGYLRRVQERDGGWALAEQGPSNSQSTAWAVQGLVAAGVNAAPVSEGGRGPFDFLAARRAGDGHYRYSASSDQTPVWVTGQALLAVARESFPLAAVPRARGHPAPTAQPRARHEREPRERVSEPVRSPAKTDDLTPERAKVKGASKQGRPRQERVALAPAANPGREAPRLLVFGGLGLLTLGLAAGYLWYRRTLP